jgi:hypothetical protein
MLLDQLVAGCERIGGWFTVLMLWLFMLANGAVFLFEVRSRPTWAVGTLVAGQGIGIVLLWMANWIRRELRRGSSASRTSRAEQ